MGVMTSEQARERGKKGGERTLAKYGKDLYRSAGKKGGAGMKAKAKQMKKETGKDYFSIIGSIPKKPRTKEQHGKN